MVYMKRILFLLVVISFLCSGLVDSSISGENDREILKDINSAHGVIEISKERDKRRAANLHRECLDCHDGLQDWTHANPSSLRSKRATKSKIRRRGKMRLKKLADAPATNSKSFSNYFSNFWKKDKPSIEKQQSPSKRTKKAKVKKANRANKPKKTVLKSKALTNLKQKGGQKTKEKSLVNYFSNYWENGQGGATRGSQSISTDVKADDKKESQTGKTNSQETDDNDSTSLLNHFSSFWSSGQSSSSSDGGNTQKTPSNVGKTKTSKGTGEKNNDALKLDKNAKTRKRTKDRQDKRKKNGRKETTKSISVSQSNSIDVEKTRKRERTRPPERQREVNRNRPDVTIDTRENANGSDQENIMTEKPRKIKIRKTQTNRKRLKNIKGTKYETERSKPYADNDDNTNTDKSSESFDVPKPHAEVSNTQNTVIENSKKGGPNTGPKTKERTRVAGNNRRNRNRKTKSQKKASKKRGGDRNLSKLSPDTTSNAVDNAESPTIIDFQGLKSELNPKTDSRVLPETTLSHRIAGNANEDTEIGVTKRPQTVREKTTVSSFSQNNKHTTGLDAKYAEDPGNTPKLTQPTKASTYPPKTADVKNAEISRNVDAPAKFSENTPGPKPVKMEKPRRKKIKNSSKRLTYVELLAKAESAFKKKNEKIMKKLNALGEKTGKRYKKFKSMSAARFNEVLPTATFDVPHPDEQVSLTDMKDMVVNLYNYSMEGYDENVQGDEPMLDYSSSDEDSKYDLSNWDTSFDYDLNDLIDLSRNNRRNETKSQYDYDVDITKNDNDLESEPPSKKTSGGFSFFNYYSSFWKAQPSNRAKDMTSPKPSPKTRKQKSPDKGRKRRKGKKRKEQNQKSEIDELEDEIDSEIAHASLSDLGGEMKDERNKIQNKNPPEAKKKRKSKSRKKGKKNRRRIKSRPKRETNDESAMEEVVEEDNLHHLVKRDANNMPVAPIERKSRSRNRRPRKRGKKGKGKNKKSSPATREKKKPNSSANLPSLDTPTSQRHDPYSRHSPKRQRQSRTRDRGSKRSKSRTRKRPKSRRNRLKPLIAKRVKQNDRNKGALVEKRVRKPSSDIYVRDQGGPEHFVDNDGEDLPMSRTFRNKNSKSKSKRGRRTRLNRRRKKKQPRKDGDFQSKRAQNDIDERRYRDGNGDYYYAVRGRDLGYEDRGGGYYYDRRGRHSRRHLDDNDEHYDGFDGYDRGGRVIRRRYHDNGRTVYRRKEIHRDVAEYLRGDENFKNTGDDGHILYYIYPVRRGQGRNNGDHSQGGRGSRRNPGDTRRRDPHPRREDGYGDGYDDGYPRAPVSRWRGRDEYSNGHSRYAPRQDHRYDAGSRREDMYGSSRPGPQEVRGRDGRRRYDTDGSHPSRERGDGDGPPRGGQVDRDRGLDSGRGRRISSRPDTVHVGGQYGSGVDGRRRPPSPRDDYYYAQLEKRRQQERIRVMERQRELQLRRVTPRVRQKVDSLTRHLHGVLRHYTEVMARSERMYTEIFNATRYDIMDGMRDVYDDLNEANGDIYDAVVGASTTARSIFMKAHKQRAAQIKGLTNDEPVMKIKEAEAMVSSRNFRNNLLRAQREKQQLEVRERHFTMLRMKFTQGKARLQQVKEHFKNNYDHEILLDLFNNMRASIEYVNEELACSYNLKPLRRDKLYLEHTRKEINVAKKALYESREAVQNGQMKYMEIKGLFQKYENEKYRNSRRFNRDQARRGRRRGKRDTNPAEFEKLKRMTSQCRRHGMELNRTADIIRRTLERPIMRGRAAIQRRGRKVPLSQLTPIIVKLRGNVKGMFMTLDRLRMYVESQPKIILTKRCSERLIEGSGAGDGDDEDFECIEEEDATGYGMAQGDDDFVFEAGEKGIPETSIRSNPMKMFGVQLSEYTSQLLSKSENLHDSAHYVMVKATKGLRQRLQISTLGKDLSMKKDVQNDLVTLRSHRQQITLQLLQISRKLDSLNEIDYGSIKARAIEALKRAKEESSKKPTKLVIAPTQPTTSNTTEPTESSNWELFRKGKDIESNNNDINYLQTLALNVYSKSCGKIDKIQSNISTLMQKVQKARNMLSSLQLSMSKTSDSPIPVPIPPRPDIKANGQVTTLSICVKPTSLDGTLLYLQGNKSASYSLALDDGELTAYVYDEDNDEQDDLTLDEELEKDKWYTIQMTRTGHALVLSVKPEGGELFKATTKISDVPLLQPPFAKSFVGGVPSDAEISGNPWQGCVGELVVNGQALSTFQSSLDGQQPALCADHCISQDRNLMWTFDGDGFVHYSQSSQEAIESISVSFKTTQSTGAIMSVVNARRRFHFYISLENGAVKVETSNEVLRGKSDSFNNGTLHTLKIRFERGRVNAQLNGDGSAFSSDRSRPSPYRNIMDGVLIASFVSEDRKYLNDRYRPLIGCVGRLVINGNPMLSTDTAEVYRARYGRCEMKSVWQSCSSFTGTSVPISLGSVDDSNKISFFVNKNATGPLMLLDKEDNFKVTIVMTSDHIDVSSEDSQSVLVKNDEGDDDHFTLITIEDEGKSLIVNAFGQSTSVDYLAWYQTSDKSAPHTISFGQTREDDDDQSFVGYLSQLVIGNKLYDLTQYDVESKLGSCVRPLRDTIPPNQNIVHEEISFCS